MLHMGSLYDKNHNVFSPRVPMLCSTSCSAVKLGHGCARQGGEFNVTTLSGTAETLLSMYY